MDRLIALDCPTGIVRFIRKWLYLRSVHFTVNSREFIERLVFKGLSQGAVLSPALYSLYIREACVPVYQTGWRLSSNADSSVYLLMISVSTYAVLTDDAIGLSFSWRSILLRTDCLPLV